MKSKKVVKDYYVSRKWAYCSKDYQSVSISVSMSTSKLPTVTKLRKLRPISKKVSPRVAKRDQE